MGGPASLPRIHNNIRCDTSARVSPTAPVIFSLILRKRFVRLRHLYEVSALHYIASLQKVYFILSFLKGTQRHCSWFTPFSLLLSLIKLRDNDRPQITYGILWLSGWSEPEFFHLNENLSLSSLSRGKSIPTSMKSLASVSELASALALNGRNSVLPLSQRLTILFWFIKSSYVF